MDKFIEELIKKVCTISPLYLVGGIVRDQLLNRPNKDVDGIVQISLEELEEHLREWGYHPIRIGAKHQTLSVFQQGERVDFNPYEGDLVADALRRDFTINAIFLDARTGEIIDPLNGRLDLEKKVLRACGNPQERFKEDPMRILRMVRFRVKYGMEVEGETFAAARELLSNLLEVAPERISEELSRILTIDDPITGIRLLDEIGYLDLFLPELTRLKGLAQNRYHLKDAWEHTLHVISNTPAQLILRLAGLFHDLGKWEVASRECYVWGKCRAEDKGYFIGDYQILGRHLHRYNGEFVEVHGARLDNYPRKIQVKRMGKDLSRRSDFEWVQGGKRHFLGHEKESGQLSQQILSRFRFSMVLGKEGAGGEKDLIWLVENHMSGTQSFFSELRGEGSGAHLHHKMRRFVWDKGWDGRTYNLKRVDQLLSLWRADFYGGKRREPQEEEIFDKLIEKLRIVNLAVQRRNEELDWDQLVKFARDHTIEGREWGDFKETLRRLLVLSEETILLDEEYLAKEYKHFRGRDKNY
ncbi:tRNA nucleotidyltransferase/poly(A) polymerase [Desulfitobacterium dichloroeliminans LMG P-21439]|uniref:tRNA nucleotidyltransferase/poly(A) polymerase n=1 Tax=Desulfitobacterium dichloroeliminans (strain LMG P-21439 / DCA1) TaxID=871963 RepID=L0F7T5_DESDL|nr:CCA tRNA nucleotidyltransferase [Desulfitobacterium dichloroeliminans]AGA69075.1 tRNA nucleotidyltransferase/poly(A) polymerase [Desulfitobacterium dichloroeliminans LMG P-21439]